jgi:Fe-S cluster biogenesis protein NfuA/nitrite reductase/ring-hydroxylating ferredoxin subunit
MAAPARIVEERELQKRLAHVDTLVGELERLPDLASRALVEELLSTVLDLHGEALSRMLGVLGPRGEPATDQLLERMAADDVIRGVLLLHGLHPLDLRSRVEGALESVRPYMRSHGGGVELLDVIGDTVRIRLEGHCKTCPSSTVTLKLAVEKAIYEAAPDVATIEVEEPPGAPVQGPPQIAGLVALPVVRASHPASHPSVAARPTVTVSGEWVTLAARASHVNNGSVLKTSADGDSVLIARTGDVYYAYVAKCPACEGSMDAASLDGAVLVCDGCAGRYDIRRAGAGIGSDFRIEPLPLLEESGVLRIAIPTRLA